MAVSILNPDDSVEVQNQKLLSIAEALMNRVEHATDKGGEGFSYFQTAISLGEQVKDRTRDLQDALEHLNRANAELGATKAEAEAARTQFANALEAVQEGFALFDKDERMVMRNSRFCGYLPDVSADLQPPMAYDDYVSKVGTSAYLALDGDDARRQFHDRRLAAHRNRHVNFTVELRRDRWVQVSEQQTPDGGTAIIQTEITDMVRQERQERDKLLDTQTTMIRATLDHLNQGVAIFDAKNCLVGSNRRLQSLLNPPVQLLRLGTSFSTVAEYFDQQRFFTETKSILALSKWVASENRTPLNLRVSTVNGQVFDIFSQEMPDRGFVISLTDITSETEAELALKRLNETLEHRVLERTEELMAARDVAERANESRSRFVAAVSHDLLQPLNAAKLFLAGMKENDIPEGEAGKLVRARNALGSVETILGALLDITRLDGAEPGINRGDLPLLPVLRSLASEYRQVAEAKGIALEVDQISVTVDTDQTYFRRVLQNLISNAIRYTDTGLVQVKAQVVGDEVMFQIIDTGRGIPLDRQGEIFKEFIRLENGPEAPGMGLGLAIVDRACRLLGHPLHIESGKGRGTTFTLHVPVAKGRPDVVGLADDTLSRTLPLKGLAALIVENDAETSAALAQLLEGWDMHVFEAAGQHAASEMLREIDLTPDVILSDYHLGDGDNGLETCAHFRERFGDIPMLLITADRAEGIQRQAAASGMDVLFKPVGPEALRTRLETLLST